MNIFFGEDAFAQLSMLTNSYDKFFVLTDENIYGIYSSMIASILPEKEVVKIVLPAGEESKSIENVMLIWNKLLDAKAGRDSLMINLKACRARPLLRQFRHHSYQRFPHKFSFY